MSNELTSPESLLSEAREMLRQEWVGLQVVGRALTPDEERRSDRLGRTVSLLDQALTVLAEESSEHAA